MQHVLHPYNPLNIIIYQNHTQKFISGVNGIITIFIIISVIVIIIIIIIIAIIAASHWLDSPMSTISQNYTNFSYLHIIILY